MNPIVIGFLRLFLVLVVVGTVLAQVLIPIVASDMGEQYWEVEPLALPYSVAGIVVVLCVQVAVVAIWRLLTLVARGEVFSEASRSWVNIIIGTGAVVAVIGVGAGAHLGFGAHIGGPLVGLLFLGSLVGGATFVLLMMVMRGLLDSATADRDELAEVI